MSRDLRGALGALICTAAFVVATGTPATAGAATGAPLPIHDGLQDAGFEAPLDPAANWTAEVRPPAAGSYPGETAGSAPATLCPSSGPDLRRGICVVGEDRFTPTGGFYPGESDAAAEEVVTPLEGTHMLRLGGPYTSFDQRQPRDRYLVRQRFRVSAAQQQLDVNTNSYTWDYSGYDSLDVSLTLSDDDGDVLYRQTRGSIASGVSLKRTGWIRNRIDLSDYVGQDVTLTVDSGGTIDDLYGFWTYVDAGTVPTPPVSAPTADAPATTPTGAPITVSEQSGEGEQRYFVIPIGQANAFTQADGTPPCLPLGLSVPIDAGQGVVSQVELRLLDSPFSKYHRGPQALTLEDPDSDGTWSPAPGGHLCADTGDLQVQYTVVEAGTSQQFVVPLGGIALIDPAGTAYSKPLYDSAVAAGASAAEALRYAAVGGASVRLLRRASDGQLRDVLSGDPGIAPRVNPQVTPTDGGQHGRFAWDVAAGDYAVAVTAPGYADTTSRVATVPPPVLDLDVPLTPVCPAGQAVTVPAYDATAQHAGDRVSCQVVPCPEGTVGVAPDCAPPPAPITETTPTTTLPATTTTSPTTTVAPAVTMPTATSTTPAGESTAPASTTPAGPATTTTPAAGGTVPGGGATGSAPSRDAAAPTNPAGSAPTAPVSAAPTPARPQLKTIGSTLHLRKGKLVLRCATTPAIDGSCRAVVRVRVGARTLVLATRRVTLRSGIATTSVRATPAIRAALRRSGTMGLTLRITLSVTHPGSAPVTRTSTARLVR